MDAKILIALLIAINCYSSCGAALRRTPKVYNALITTDENLTSSRAYPVIQPTIHEQGLAHYPFGPYNPYGYYNPSVVRFGRPIAPGLVPRQQFPYPLPQNQFPPQILHQPQNPVPQLFPGYPPPSIPPTAPAGEQQPSPNQPAPDSPSKDQPTQQPDKPPQEQTPPYIPGQQNGEPQQMPNEKLPIPLNEFGLPPALIPLQQYPSRNRNPVHLPPYGFNQFPVIYDPITGYREQYLPPYQYFPSHTYAVGPTSPQNPNQQQPPRTPPQYPNQQQPSRTPPQYPNQQQPPRTPPQYPNQQQPPANPPPTLPPSENNNTEEETTEESAPITDSTPPDFDNVKNVSKSKNSDVPDVPPPPIPSGAKAK